VPGDLVGSVPDSGQEEHSLELTTHPVVNTLGPPPGLLDLVIPIALVTDEPLSSLLDDLRPGGRSESHLLLSCRSESSNIRAAGAVAQLVNPLEHVDPSVLVESHFALISEHVTGAVLQAPAGTHVF